MSKFFEDKEEEQEETQEEKISLGEEEFTQEELEELVGKAKKVNEFEEKQGQSWEDVTKSWGQRGERIGEYKKELEELKSKVTEFEKPKEQVDQEQLEKQIKGELRKYGSVLEEDFETKVAELYNKFRSGEKVLTKVRRVIRDNSKKGYPKPTERELLEYMNDPANPADPEKAYKLMYEDEMRKIDAGKLDRLKKPGMQTESKSTAGSKDYQAPKITKENLSSVLKDHFRSGGEG